ETLRTCSQYRRISIALAIPADSVPPYCPARHRSYWKCCRSRSDALCVPLITVKAVVGKISIVVVGQLSAQHRIVIRRLGVSWQKTDSRRASGHRLVYVAEVVVSKVLPPSRTAITTHAVSPP